MMRLTVMAAAVAAMIGALLVGGAMATSVAVHQKALRGAPVHHRHYRKPVKYRHHRKHYRHHRHHRHHPPVHNRWNGL